MHRLELFADQFSDRAAEFHQLRRAQIVQPGIGPLRLDDRIIIAAIGHIQRQRTEARHIDLNPLGRQIGGDVTDADGGDLRALLFILDMDGARRHLDLQLARFARGDEAVFQAEGNHANRAMPAHRQATARLDEQDRRVAVGLARRIEKAADIMSCPRGSKHSPVRIQSNRSGKSSRRSAMLAPRSSGAPPATSRTGLPAVWPSMQKKVWRIVGDVIGIPLL